MRGEEVGVEQLVAADRVVGTNAHGLGGEREQEARDQQEGARVDRSGVADERPDDEREAEAREQHGKRVGDGADEPGQRGLDARAG